MKSMLLLVLIAAFLPLPRAFSQVTYHNDNARTGQYLNETILTPSNVGVSTFGKIRFFSVDGKVDAQPLYLSAVSIPSQGQHNVLTWPANMTAYMPSMPPAARCSGKFLFWARGKRPAMIGDAVKSRRKSGSRPPR